MSKQASMLGPGGRIRPPLSKESRRLLDEGIASARAGKVRLLRLQPETLLDKVRAVMSDNRYRAAFEIQREVDIRYGTYASESSIAARIRELRQSPWRLTVLRRKAPGKRYYQYALEGE